jgi:hypothetical protein
MDSSHAILLCPCMGSISNTTAASPACHSAGGLLQHVGEVPGGDGAADPGSNGVLQERGEAAAARLDLR